MHTDFNFIPPAAFAALLGAIFGTVFAGAVVLICTVIGKRQIARAMALIWGTGATVYALLLLGCAVWSQQKVLAKGQEKYFCEVDCHTAYSVAAVKTAAELGGRKANGVFYVVALRTRFDEETISPHRGNGWLTPNPRSVAVETDDGRRFGPADAAPEILEGLMGAKNTPINQALRPSESYVTLVAFELPADAHGPRLLLTSAGWETHWLVGQENSFFHRKTYLQM